MLKIIGICGSPRKKATYRALEEAMNAVKAEGGDEVETEIISLQGKKCNPCLACNKCIRDNSPICTLYKDDVTDELQKILDCDGLILASPVFEMCPTPQIMSFLSRFRGGWVVLSENPDLFAKKVGGAIAVGGTRNGGQENVVRCLNSWFHTQGWTPVNGGLCMYEGACVWSQDKGAEGAEADEEGMIRCRRLGQKVYRMAKALQNTDVFDTAPIKVFNLEKVEKN